MNNAEAWRKGKGYWDKGKWVPNDVASALNEKLEREVWDLKNDMKKHDVDVHIEMNKLRKERARADRERIEALQDIKHLK